MGDMGEPKRRGMHNMQAKGGPWKTSHKHAGIFETHTGFKLPLLRGTMS